MKTSRSFIPVFQIAMVSCLTVGSLAEAQQAPVYPQYAASTYYPPQKPSVMDRIRGAGQNVGDFVRRKFYGEGAPASYQQSAYPTSGGYRTQRYNLDAPAPAEAPPSRPATTGFQEPTRATTPKYVTPPRDDEPAEKPKAKTESAAPKKTESKPVTTTSKTKSSAPATRSKEQEVEPEKTTASASKKRYTPAKPSTVAKAPTKSTTEKKRVEDQPPASKPQKHTESSEVVRYDAPPKEPAVESSIKTETTPPAPTETTSLSPTIGGTNVDLTPTNVPEPKTETKSTDSSESKTTVTEGQAKSGSFIVGKKGSKPGRVVSPYAPYNELDVTGLPSGSLALDPTTQKVFQVP